MKKHRECIADERVDLSCFTYFTYSMLVWFGSVWMVLNRNRFRSYMCVKWVTHSCIANILHSGRSIFYVFCWLLFVRLFRQLNFGKGNSNAFAINHTNMSMLYVYSMKLKRYIDIFPPLKMVLWTKRRKKTGVCIIWRKKWNRQWRKHTTHTHQPNRQNLTIHQYMHNEPTHKQNKFSSIMRTSQPPKSRKRQTETPKVIECVRCC